MPRVIMVLFLLAIMIYALIDCIRTDASEMPARVSKPIWIVAIIILPVLGSVFWLAFKMQKLWKTDSNFGAADLSEKFRNRANHAPTGPVAPDNDPDFLSRLEAQNRRRQYEQKKAEEHPDQADKKKKRPHEQGDEDSRGLYG